MKKFLVALAVLAVLPSASASADSFVLGSTSNSVSYWLDGHYYSGVGGGSFDVSKLNGTNLPWVCCADLLHEIRLNGSYPNTLVRTDGVVNGSTVNNSAKIAWLLGSYAATAAWSGAMEGALQGVMWEVIYGSRFQFNPTSAQLSYFNTWSTGIQSGNVANYLWLTPDSRCLGGSCYAPDCKQGLVTYQPVPDAGSTLMLLGAALAGLGAWRRSQQ